MKRTVIALVLLALIVGLCFGSGLFLDRQATELIAALTQMETAYRQNDLDACRALAENVIQTFDQNEAVYPYFLHHKTVHDLSESLRKIPVWLECGDDSAFYAELVRCRLLADEMRRTETPLPENIF